MTAYEKQLERRQNTLKALKNRKEELGDQIDSNVAQRLEMYFRKMARAIDRTNFDVYRKEAEALLAAQETLAE